MASINKMSKTKKLFHEIHCRVSVPSSFWPHIILANSETAWTKGFSLSVLLQCIQLQKRTFPVKVEQLKGIKNKPQIITPSPPPNLFSFKFTDGEQLVFFHSLLPAHEETSGLISSRECVAIGSMVLTLKMQQYFSILLSLSYCFSCSSCAQCNVGNVRMQKNKKKAFESYLCLDFQY